MRPQLAADVETAEFAFAGGCSYVMVANPKSNQTLASVWSVVKARLRGLAFFSVAA
jgi:hypothetical protein